MKKCRNNRISHIKEYFGRIPFSLFDPSLLPERKGKTYGGHLFIFIYGILFERKPMRIHLLLIIIKLR